MAENERAAPWLKRSGAGERQNAAGADDLNYSDNCSSSTRGLTRTATCSVCGARFEARRATAIFCSARCRQRAARGGENTDSKQIVQALAALGLVGKLWPVSRNDPSPAIYGLMVSRSTALAELNASRSDGDAVSDSDLRRTLRERRILDWHEALPLSVTKTASRSRGGLPPDMSR